MILKIIFSGRVQGVGFRYRAEEFAAKFQIKGSVRNLADGSVELIAQGPQDNINKLQNSLSNYFGEKIESMDVQELNSATVYEDFRISV
jgi:acylphosphatase